MKSNDASENKMVQPEGENKAAVTVAVKMLRGALTGRTIRLSKFEAARFVRIGNAEYLDQAESKNGV